MTRSVIALVFCGVLVGGVVRAADEDAIGAKLATAKAEYEKGLTKARDGLVAELKKKADAAQKAGDLKALEKVDDEIKALEEKDTLPKLVPARDYTEAKRVAAIRLKSAYEAAVKEYTVAGNKDFAKATQAALEELKKETGSDAKDGPDDGLPVGTKLAGTAVRVVGQPGGKPPLVTGNEWQTMITKRSGKDFTAEYADNQWEGTITNGVVKMTYTKGPKQAEKDAIGNIRFLGRFDKEKGTLSGTMTKKTDPNFVVDLKLKVVKD